MAAPVLLTERLWLDGHRADDLEPLAAMWRDDAVYGPIGGKARDREEVCIRLLRSIGQWTLSGYGAWVVRERSDGAVVGEIGLIEARRAIEPPLDAPEMGWLIAPRAHGRGYAREALAAILAWVDAQSIARTVCIIDPGNTRSIALAGRVGYRTVGRRVYHQRPIDVYERVR